MTIISGLDDNTLKPLLINKLINTVSIYNLREINSILPPIRISYNVSPTLPQNLPSELLQPNNWIRTYMPSHLLPDGTESPQIEGWQNLACHVYIRVLLSIGCGYREVMVVATLNYGDVMLDNDFSLYCSWITVKVTPSSPALELEFQSDNPYTLERET